MTVLFRVLGPLDVANVPLAAFRRARRRRRLLATLLCRRGSVVPEDVLSHVVWGADAPVDASAALHNQIHRLRQLLPDGMLQACSPGYALHAPSGSVDADVFERLLHQVRSRTVAEPEAGLATLDSALALWRGSSYEEFTDDVFFAAEAQRLQELYLVAHEERHRLLIGLSREGEAAAGLTSLVAAHPLREGLRVLLMTAFHRLGRSGDALATYADYRHHLSDELGLQPSPVMCDLQKAILENRTAPWPGTSVAAPDSAWTELTVDSSPTSTRGPVPSPRQLFGRDTDQDLICELLRRNHTVTVTGPPGVGKSWFILGMAERLAARYPGGVTHVCLGEVRMAPDPRQAVRAALNHARAQGASSMAGSGARIVLLDDCDGLPHAARRDLLALADFSRGDTVLAASRSPLGCGEERVQPLDVLPVPEPEADLSTIKAAAAVQLFLERAERAGAQLAFPPETLRVVAELCRRLDGLPLAIDLAAARCRSMFPEEILTRLDDAAVLLQSPSRHDRHRSLTSAVESSYILLTALQRQVLECLSELPYPFRLLEAEAACASSGIPQEAVAPSLDDLVNHSLILARRKQGDISFVVPRPFRNLVSSKTLLQDNCQTGGRPCLHYALSGADADLHCCPPAIPERS
ncbi:BTAD domain-containing putative transcriptional regulator [Streptomyces sp. R11]|uniref:BTAD domain-containing putative transcriptional regulator n=1 Tax=Streptomyces sp. R11 TaxID=3238625 RepID=A0AB39NBK0_9ACTN